MSRRIILLLLVVLAITLVLFGIFYAQPAVAPHNDSLEGYISSNTTDCQKLLFTCPQGQEPFSDASGCGCQASSTPDNPDARSLQNLVQNYLAQKVLTPQFGGQVFAEFMYLDGVTNPDTKLLKYNVWALIKEYYPKDGLLQTGTAISSPMIISIEETGKAYIIRGYTLPEEGDAYADSVKNMFTPEAQEWISGNDDGNRTAKINRLIRGVRSQASMAYQLPIAEPEPVDASAESTPDEGTADAASSAAPVQVE